jgi:hypothetical protein
MKSAVKPIFSENTHHQIYFILFCALAMSMPITRFGMSLTQILMGVNWLFEGQYRQKIIRFRACKPAIIFMLLYVIHIIGLFWSEDLEYGILYDLKDKLPMLTLTFLVASSKPLNARQANLLLSAFLIAVFMASLIGLQIFLSGNYVNFRDLSPFMLHIYVGMMLCMAIFTLPWFTFKLTKELQWRLISIFLALWLTVFLFVMRTMTGILCFGVVLLFFVIRIIAGKYNIWLRISIGSLVILAGVAFFVFTMHMYGMINKKIMPSEASLIEKTALGNDYQHIEHPHRENGYFVYLFIAEDEVRQAWNERSSFDFDSLDMRENPLNLTLFRYLTSMGYRKDRESVEKLSEEDITAVETGVPNSLYVKWPGALVRFHETLWEINWYLETGNPSGHSFTQRIDMWKGAWEAIKVNPWLGWGTGDIYIAMDYGLHKINSHMDTYRWKPHNQYLLFLITLGIIGSLAIYLCYFIYISLTRAWKFLPFNIFLIIMVVSMLGNNPIDAQSGQTFFTFFTLFFGIIYKKDYLTGS